MRLMHNGRPAHAVSLSYDQMDPREWIQVRTDRSCGYVHRTGKLGPNVSVSGAKRGCQAQALAALAERTGREGWIALKDGRI